MRVRCPTFCSTSRTWVTRRFQRHHDWHNWPRPMLTAINAAVRGGIYMRYNIIKRRTIWNQLQRSVHRRGGQTHCAFRFTVIWILLNVLRFAEHVSVFNLAYRMSHVTTPPRGWLLTKRYEHDALSFRYVRIKRADYKNKIKINVTYATL